MAIDPVLAAFIRAVPKVELHLHLVGSASPQTVARLAERTPGSGVPHDPVELARFFEFTDFDHFIEVYIAVNSLVTTGEDIADLVDGAAADLAAQQVRYAEMTITPYSHVVSSGIAYDDVLAGLADGRRRAAARGVELAWVYDIPGEVGVAAGEVTVDLAVNRPPDGLVGFGLGGPEAWVDRTDYADIFDRARAAGLRSVPHAGEGDGPASIWRALGFLRAERLGHGVRAIEDERLLAHIVERQIPLEVCPSSNVCTRVYPDLASHPVRRLVDAGALVTINSDDPPMFSTTLTDEYLRIAEQFRFDLDEIATLVANGVRSSFLSASRRRALLAEIETARLAAVS